jgi:hypothetical protein
MNLTRDQNTIYESISSFSENFTQMAFKDDLLADWDPLQGGYQAIVDICEEARSRTNIAPSQLQNIYKPERASTFDQTKNSDNLFNSLQIPSPETMLPPKCFHKRSRNLFEKKQLNVL